MSGQANSTILLIGGLWALIIGAKRPPRTLGWELWVVFVRERISRNLLCALPTSDEPTHRISLQSKDYRSRCSKSTSVHSLPDAGVFNRYLLCGLIRTIFLSSPPGGNMKRAAFLGLLIMISTENQVRFTRAARNDVIKKARRVRGSTA
jgi:hypothetical protein